jgi:hypothetical protein
MSATSNAESVTQRRQRSAEVEAATGPLESKLQIERSKQRRNCEAIRNPERFAPIGGASPIEQQQYGVSRTQAKCVASNLQLPTCRPQQSKSTDQRSFCFQFARCAELSFMLLKIAHWISSAYDTRAAFPVKRRAVQFSVRPALH